jgi:protein TonB
MSPRPDIAWSRQLARTTPGQVILWSIAALVMLTAHATAAWWVMREPPPPPIQIAGSSAIEVDLAALGFGEADMLAAGEAVEAAEPVEIDTAVPVETARPVEATPVERTEPVEETPREETTEVETQEPVRAETVTSPAARLAEAQSEVEIAALPPTEREATVDVLTASPVEVETVEPVEENEQLAALMRAPLPTPRPDYTPPPRAQPQRTERPQREKPTQQTRRPAAGSQGNAQATTNKGTQRGSTQGRAANDSAGNHRRTAEGNAAVTNYPGQVARKLRRALRSPRSRDRGEVLVSFTVSRSGSVSGVRVARGSGSPVLDRAALETVQRAAPFPPIPAAAGRSSWDFQLPLAFSR